MKQMPISKLNDRLNGDTPPRLPLWERARKTLLKKQGQERHSGRTANRILTLSLLRAHFYTGVFHTSYVRSARLQQPTAMLVLSASLRSGQGSATLAPLCSYPGALAFQTDFTNQFETASLKRTFSPKTVC